MVRKVMRPSGRSRVTIRYRRATEPPEAVAPLVAVDRPTISSWNGCRIKLEDLDDFKAEWGLITVYAEWPEEATCPIVYLVEVQPRQATGHRDLPDQDRMTE
jgi:hypothetical protein